MDSDLVLRAMALAESPPEGGSAVNGREIARL